MAYEYDRLEREDGGGSFLMGLLAGTVLGAGLGMLFAPKAGIELRNQLSEQTGTASQTTANDAYSQASEKVSQMVDAGREAYDRARTRRREHRRVPASARHRRERDEQLRHRHDGGYGTGGYGHRHRAVTVGNRG